MIEIILVFAVISAMVLSLWKPLAGLFPLIFLWGYGWFKSFSVISFNALVYITILHVLVQAISWLLSGKHRSANLAFTGAGITGFATAVLASLFFGPLLGFFIWIGSIGRLITKPVSIGIKPIVKSFLGGLIKLVYGVVLAAGLAYTLS